MFTPKGLYIGDTNRISIIFDSGCSVEFPPCKDGFEYTLISITKIMQGLGPSAQAHGEGRVNWMFKDDYGVTQEINVKAYCIPTSSVRLFNP